MEIFKILSIIFRYHTIKIELLYFKIDRNDCTINITSTEYATGINKKKKMEYGWRKEELKKSIKETRVYFHSL